MQFMHRRFTIISNDFHNEYMITGWRFQFRKKLGRITVLIKDPIMQWSSFLTHEDNTDFFICYEKFDKRFV